MKAALIASTYEQAPELRVFLDSVERQNTGDFQVYLTNDGSGEETTKVIEEFQERWGEDRLKHFYQENQGFRKSKILNTALQALDDQIEWLVFVDADTILDPHFFEDHLSLSKRNRVVTGRRVDLNPWMSRWVCSHPNLVWKSNRFSDDFWQNLLISSFQKPATRNPHRSLRILRPSLRKWMKADNVRDLLGSNFSICRRLIDSLGGFDESYETYWGEDGDLFIRSLEAGAEVVGRKSFANQFHLWHPRRKWDLEEEREYNFQLDKAKQRNKELRAGLDRKSP